VRKQPRTNTPPAAIKHHLDQRTDQIIADDAARARRRSSGRPDQGDGKNDDGGLSISGPPRRSDQENRQTSKNRKPFKLASAQERARQQKAALVDNCRLLSRQKILDLLDVSYPTLWGWVKEGHFPAPRSLSGNDKRGRLAWLESEVSAWIAARPVRLPKGSKTREGAVA
jgi:predicted DNA-binding transcriptional regulator AlpA